MTERAKAGDKPTEETKIDDTVAASLPPTEGDRVAMLSLKADGTPDQTDPTIVIPKDDAIAATTEQLAQRAGSTVDQTAERDEGGALVDPAGVAAAHDAAVNSAGKDAEKVVNDLHEDA